MFAMAVAATIPATADGWLSGPQHEPKLSVTALPPYNSRPATVESR